MNNSFLEVMESHPDKKLKEIVESERGDYKAQAIEAAEFVLRKRKVKFKEAEPLEIVEMTYDEIREDIEKRKANGESMPSIRKYYKEAGVDVDSAEVKGDSDRSGQPWSFRKVRGVFFLVGAGAAILVNINNQGMSGGATIALVVIGGISAVWIYIDFSK